jgi:protein TonB
VVASVALHGVVVVAAVAASPAPALRGEEGALPARIEASFFEALRTESVEAAEPASPEFDLADLPVEFRVPPASPVDPVPPLEPWSDESPGAVAADAFLSPRVAHLRVPSRRAPVAVPAAAPRVPPASGEPGPEEFVVVSRPADDAVYPPQARRRGEQGTVLVEILVDRTGLVIEARLARSSGHEVLDRDALRKVREYRFAPLPGPRRARLPFDYRVE